MFFNDYLKSCFKKMLKKPLIIKAASFLIFLYAKFIGLTNRWKIINPKETNEIISSDSAIFVGWHSRAIMLPCFWRKITSRKLYALVSAHQDGQLIANFLKFYGITPISGSTNEKASQSALEIIRLLSRGMHVFISPDGPRGPRMRMKKSAIYFASKTGCPIFFVTYSLSKSLLAEKAWDKTLIPLPFGHGIFKLSQPFYVPSGLNDDEIEQYRLNLENLANDMNFDCDKTLGKTPVQPADKNEIKKKRF